MRLNYHFIVSSVLVKRTTGRRKDELRPISFEVGCNKHAEGSCFVRCGDTHVVCTATVDERVPSFLHQTGGGWVTAEYGMLPRSTNTRMLREVTRGRPSGRTQEIQRLIGRSLRAVTDLKKLGERQVRLDCDVLQADGGTRTAAINGAWVALRMALERLIEHGCINVMPLTDQIAAVSCGIFQGEEIVDLDYGEDSAAEADVNFVLTGEGGIVEIQGTAEAGPFTEAQFSRLFELARVSARDVFELQRAAVKSIAN